MLVLYSFVIFFTGGDITNYYEKIKDELLDNELTKKAKDYSTNVKLCKTAKK